MELACGVDQLGGREGGCQQSGNHWGFGIWKGRVRMYCLLNSTPRKVKDERSELESREVIINDK